jgi:hypothetical protein
VTTPHQAFWKGGAAGLGVMLAAVTLHYARPNDYAQIVILIPAVAVASFVGARVAPSWQRAAVFALGVLATVTVSIALVMGPAAYFGLVLMLPMLVPAALAGIGAGRLVPR